MHSHHLDMTCVRVRLGKFRGYPIGAEEVEKC